MTFKVDLNIGYIGPFRSHIKPLPSSLASPNQAKGKSGICAVSEGDSKTIAFALKSHIQHSETNSQTLRQVLLSSRCQDSVRQTLLRIFRALENEELPVARISR